MEEPIEDLKCKKCNKKSISIEEFEDKIIFTCDCCGFSWSQLKLTNTRW